MPELPTKSLPAAAAAALVQWGVQEAFLLGRPEGEAQQPQLRVVVMQV